MGSSLRSPLGAPALVAFFAVLCSLWSSSCGFGSGKSYQGYVEGDFVYIGSPQAGRLTQLKVRRGQMVSPGDLLFVLEEQPERDLLEEVRGKHAQATAQLENLRKGRRPSEMAALAARLKSANASQHLTELELRRFERLIQNNASSREDYDRARVNYERARAEVSEREAELETARLGAREDEIHAAEAEVSALAHAVTQAQWKLEQKTQRALVAGQVFDTLFEEGEWLAAGSPVISLLAPGQVKVRFFVPEGEVATITVGQALRISADGIGKPITARVSFVSPHAEYTPPVIFSRETRSKLVFMLEAEILEGASILTTLKPGQPVDVYIE